MTAKPFSLVSTLVETFNENHKEVANLREQIRSLENILRGQVQSMLNILATLEAIRKSDPSVKVPNLTIPQELLPHRSLSIGDAIQAILQLEGAQTRKELLDKLPRMGVKMSQQHARTILNTAIRRDTQKRFKVLKDDRIALVKASITMSIVGKK